MLKQLIVLEITNKGIHKSEYQNLTSEQRALLEEREGQFFVKMSERKKIRIGLTGGVFDILHIGHIITLEEAKKNCDLLVVAIANDAHIRKKGREPIHTQEYRKRMVDELKPVDVAIAGFDDPKKMLDLVRPNVIIYGYDQKEFLKPDGVKIIKLDRKIDDSKFKTGKIIEELGL